MSTFKELEANIKLILSSTKVYGSRLTILWTTYGPEYGQPGTMNFYGPEYDQPVFEWVGNQGIQYLRNFVKKFKNDRNHVGPSATHFKPVKLECQLQQGITALSTRTITY